MPLSCASPPSLHLLQNLSLILLAVVLWPLLTLIAVTSSLISPYTQRSRHIQHRRKWRLRSSRTFRPRTVLVTGIGMSKGLSVARAFYRAGHRVIGADFEPYLVPVAGHFSAAISDFYRLSRPSPATGSAAYLQDLISIIEKEHVEIWVPCSGIASGIEDGEAAEAIEKDTNCKAFQFGLALTETLHEKHFFIDNTRRLGLNVPDTHLVTSETECLSVLYSSQISRTPPRSPGISGEPVRSWSGSEKIGGGGARYIMKSVLLDDSNRADVTLLPRPTLRETEQHIKRLSPTPFRPFVLQNFITGPEYCIHSLIIRGKVRAFVACPSRSLLMHFRPLPTSSALSQAMLMYAKTYAERTGPEMTGHFSIDFLVEADVAEFAQGKVGMEEQDVKQLMGKLYPIECNPRVHTAVVSLSDESEDLADAYLSILPDHEPKGISNGHRIESIVVPKPGTPSYYWIGHDLVSLVILPILRLFSLVWRRFRRGKVGKLIQQADMGLRDVSDGVLEFVEHVLYWRDGTFEIWDPWPAWWLYCGYWPLMFTIVIWEGRWWRMVNISTTKMFGF